MPQQNLQIPIAIVAAGALIAAALYFTGAGSSPTTPADNTPEPKEVVAVTTSDHILGDPNAPIKIVEYSDLECPFCKQFHTTMKTIIDEYGKNGQVAWVHRHFPLAQIHPNAPTLAEASECVAAQLGNTGFWNFVDAIFAAAPGNARFDMTKLTATAASVGADGAKFDACMKAGTFKAKVEKEFNDAVASGGQGTPHNIVITKDGENIPVPGAQPYENVKAVIEAALAQ